MSGGVEAGIGEHFGDDPILGGFIDSPSEEARADATKRTKEAAADFHAYRPGYQESQQARKRSVGNMLSPLNQMVLHNTGQNINLEDAIGRQMVSDSQMAIGAPRPDEKEKNHDTATAIGAGAGLLLLGDPVLGGIVGYAGSELDFW